MKFESTPKVEGGKEVKGRMIECVGCEKPYEFIKRIEYPGKSTKRCPECQLRWKTFGVGNMGSRPMGHRTRQQHKHVNPG